MNKHILYLNYILYIVTRSTLSSGALVASHSSTPELAKPVYVRSVAAT